MAPQEIEARVNDALQVEQQRMTERQKAADVAVAAFKELLLQGLKCCKQNCATHVPHDLALEVHRQRKMLPREEDRRADLLQRIQSLPEKTWLIGDVSVCQVFFLKVLATSTTALASARKENIIRATFIRPSEKEQLVCHWLDELALFGDRMPDAPEVYLPYPTMLTVFLLFQQDHPTSAKEDSTNSCEGVSYSYFQKVWRDKRALIKVNRVSNFAICDTCARFDEYRRDYRGDRVKLNELKQDMDDHVRVVHEERQVYYTRQKLTKAHPDEYLTLILDGADQSSFGLPHFFQRTKETSGVKIPMKLYGAIVHHRRQFVYTVPPNAPTGPDLVIEILYRVFKFVKAKEGSLPKSLYLQLDNTTSQNKNNFVMGFLALLVGWKIFDEVIINFLPVGHTHEDVDQMFSRFAVYNRTHDAITHLELLQNCRKAFHPSPETEHLDCQANVTQRLRDWPSFKKFPRITEPKSFRITRDPEGRPVCHVKALMSASDGWKNDLQGAREAGHYWFGESLPSLEAFFQDMPPIAFPEMEASKLSEIRSSLGKCSSRLTNQAYKLQILQSLLQDASKTKQLAFNWDVKLFRPAQADEADGSSDDEGYDTDGATQEDIRDVQFPVGHMVVLRTDANEEFSFWLGRVVENCFIGDQKCLISWFNIARRSRRTKDEKIEFAHAYVEARNPLDKTSLFIDEVKTSTIILSFEKLDEDNKIPMKIRNDIKQVELGLKK